MQTAPLLLHIDGVIAGWYFHLSRLNRSLQKTSKLGCNYLFFIISINWNVDLEIIGIEFLTGNTRALSFSFLCCQFRNVLQVVESLKCFTFSHFLPHKQAFELFS